METPTQSLAQKWRPRLFRDVVGQEIAIRAIKNALAQRQHHAYLFSGTRGIGKTTLARLIAMVLNCSSPVDGEPCHQCDSCNHFLDASFLDVIEIDAATHTQVEKMRGILESASYPPLAGSVKAVIIDEAHMLSASAFASMLKIIEEPPAHLYFLLATTRSEKLPITITSRCLHFRLPAMSPAVIAERLGHILAEEDCEADAAALAEIARLAQGSMRDSLSLTEHLLNVSRHVTMESVRALFGNAGTESIARLLAAVAKADAGEIHEISDALFRHCANFDTLLADTARLIFGAQLHKAGVVDSNGFDAPYLREVAERFASDELQVMYDLCLNARAQLAYAPDPLTGFEMTLLRMALFCKDGDAVAPRELAAEEPSAVVENTAVDSAANVAESTKPSAEESPREPAGELLSESPAQSPSEPPPNEQSPAGGEAQNQIRRSLIEKDKAIKNILRLVPNARIFNCASEK